MNINADRTLLMLIMDIQSNINDEWGKPNYSTLTQVVEECNIFDKKSTRTSVMSAIQKSKEWLYKDSVKEETAKRKAKEWLDKALARARSEGVIDPQQIRHRFDR